jgi:hypothetical protein
MAILRGNKTTAVGMFVDGLEVKYAKLSIKGGNVVLDEVGTTTLSSKIEEMQPSEAAMEGGGGGGGEGADIFGASVAEMASPEIVSGGDNSSVILGLLSKYPQGKYAVSYAVTEPSLYYHVFENDFGLKGKKLKSKIIEELQQVRTSAPARDALDYFYSAEKNLVCVVREDGLSLLKIFEEIKQLMGNRLPYIPLIDCAETSLINLARSNFGFAPEEYSVIIYIGIEYSRLIFMKGTEFLHFAPVIGEGYESPNIQNTVYAKLLLEQDNIGVPRLNKILLAGECRKIGFDQFINEQLAEVDVSYLNTPYLDVSALPPEEQDQLSLYAIPISTAWKVLDDDHPAFYPVNLIPEKIREAQRTLALAWHGWLLLAFIFVSVVFFPLQCTDLQRKIEDKKRTITGLEKIIAVNERYQQEIEILGAKIGGLKTAAGLYDTLVPGSDRWNKIIAHLSKGVEDIRSLWIKNVVLQPQGTMSMSGVSMERMKIPRIAALFENATLASVSEQKKIRDRIVMDFELKVPAQPQFSKNQVK